MNDINILLNEVSFLFASVAVLIVLFTGFTIALKFMKKMDGRGGGGGGSPPGRNPDGYDIGDEDVPF